MKRLLTFLLLFVATITQAQIFISAEGDARPFGDFPAMKSQYIKGAPKSVANITDRNNIASNLREVGMLVWVVSESKYYILSGGTTNSDWQELFAGAGAAGSYVTLNTAQTITGAKTFSSHVTLDDLKRINWGAGTTYIEGNSSTNRLYLRTNNIERLRVDENGNVGIGTSSPSSKLHVNGSMFASSIETLALYTDAISGAANSYVNITQDLVVNGTISRVGGTSSQFLKADGSVDANTYATTSALGSYLPLAGGTMTGLITMAEGVGIKSATTDGGVFAGSGNTYFGKYSTFKGVQVNTSTGLTTISDGLNVQGVIRAANNDIQLPPSKKIGAGYDFGNSSEAGSGYLEFYNSGTGGTTLMNTTSFAPLILGTNNTTRLTIGADGNSTFTGQINVPTIYFNNGFNNTTISSTGDYLDFKPSYYVRFYDATSNTPKIRLDARTGGAIFDGGVITESITTTGSGLKSPYMTGGLYDGINYRNTIFGGSVTWNGSNYIVGTDGGSNGGWMIAGEGTGETITFHTLNSSGGTTQTISASAMNAAKRLQINSAGVDVLSQLFHRSNLSVLNYDNTGWTTWATRRTSGPSGVDLNIFNLFSNVGSFNALRLGFNSRVILDTDGDSFSYVTASDGTGDIPVNGLILSSYNGLAHVWDGDANTYATIKAANFVYDGGTSGQVLKANGSVSTHAELYVPAARVNNADYTVTVQNELIEFYGLTETRFIYLPNPASMSGKRLVISLAESETYLLSFTSSTYPAILPDGTDLVKIPGGGKVLLQSNGVNWKVISFNYDEKAIQVVASTGVIGAATMITYTTPNTADIYQFQINVNQMVESVSGGSTYITIEYTDVHNVSRTFTTSTISTTGVNYTAPIAIACAPDTAITITSVSSGTINFYSSATIIKLAPLGNPF